MNILLLIVLAIIILYAYIGYKQGFIKTIFSICSLIIAIVITANVSPFVSKVMQQSEGINRFVREKVEKSIDIEFKVEEKKIIDQMKQLEELPIPETLKKALIENNNDEIYKALKVETFNEYISGYIACIVINAAAFIITFIVVNLILWFIVSTLDLISKLPIINGLNKTAGIFVGVIKGLIAIWIGCIILTMFCTTKTAEPIYKMIAESEILKSLYNNNLLLKTITGIAKVLF